ncbi:hypothetical protein IE81DRAFT_326388 [Ceraceosorus guamensis]|uniref:Uncharacterized protein n=1 Tax=Ceraceosorus guamensis TaxID=1522189 RepID=A0A316VPT4_9BASI|nr:hypothetical protein IE81DRAFT_326388 [Ceraceosorus guamensis]PWN39587.1 hypothetical protein IE81DRAFT_326388 [Ceraceosorus guamensis]
MLHAVVPIGGAAFVHPSISSPTSASDCFTSPTSRFSSSSSSSSHDGWGNDQALRTPEQEREAKVYAASVLAHTRAMWQAERDNIERAKLDRASRSPPTGGLSSSPLAKISPLPAASAAPQIKPPAPAATSRHARAKSEGAGMGLFRGFTTGRSRRNQRA